MLHQSPSSAPEKITPEERLAKAIQLKEYYRRGRGFQFSINSVVLDLLKIDDLYSFALHYNPSKVNHFTVSDRILLDYEHNKFLRYYNAAMKEEHGIDKNFDKHKIESKYLKFEKSIKQFLKAREELIKIMIKLHHRTMPKLENPSKPLLPVSAQLTQEPVPMQKKLRERAMDPSQRNLLVQEKLPRKKFDEVPDALILIDSFVKYSIEECCIFGDIKKRLFTFLLGLAANRLSGYDQGLVSKAKALLEEMGGPRSVELMMRQNFSKPDKRTAGPLGSPSFMKMLTAADEQISNQFKALYQRRLPKPKFDPTKKPSFQEFLQISSKRKEEMRKHHSQCLA